MDAGVVVVGAGFAGFWAAAAARRAGGPTLPITLVGPAPTLVLRPRLYEARPESLAVDLAGLLERLDVGFVADTATGVDTVGHRLEFTSRPGLPFERLVVATGSVMRRPPVPGADHAFSIDTQLEAQCFDRRLAAIAHTATHADTPIAQAPVVAVVGAGFTGLELALELRDRLQLHGGAALAERLRIVLIDRAEMAGPELGKGPAGVIETALREAEVELHLGASIARFAADRVIFHDGTSLVADAIVLSTGLEAAPFTSQLPGPRDHAGRVVVDSFLRAPLAPHVFVTGDAASADTGDGHRALQSCQHALQLGRYAGENAARDLIGLPLVAYQQLRYVTCLDLGRSGAVLTQGWDRQVVLTGAEAKAVKVKINTELIYPPADADLASLLRQSQLDPDTRSS